MLAFARAFPNEPARLTSAEMASTVPAPNHSSNGTAPPGEATVTTVTTSDAASNQPAWAQMPQGANSAIAGGSSARSISVGIRSSGTNASRDDISTVSENANANASGSGGSRQCPRARSVTPRMNRASIPTIVNSKSCRSGSRRLMPMSKGSATAASVNPPRTVAARSARRVVARNSDCSRRVSDRLVGSGSTLRS